MKVAKITWLGAVSVGFFVWFCTAPVLAQNGKLTIHVTPKQAYIFVDGNAIGDAGKHHSLSLPAGDHKIDLVNYGYARNTSTVTITGGQASNLDVTLQPVTATVPGPFGAMTIESASQAAILLNGKTPDYFVGHGDEFNHDWWWKQELVVPPGTYQMTVRSGDKDLWSGPVEVPANQRVVVDIPKGVRKTVPWPRGEKLTSIPRFTVGSASATVAVAKPTASLTANAAQINCGDSSQLKWTSTDAPQVSIDPVGAVAVNGDQSVQPTKTTTYQLTASGPGGTTTSTATVDVNTSVQANITVSPAEVHYRNVAGQVVQNDSAALNWSASNASAGAIDPLGSVSPTGNRTVTVTPKKTDPGPVDENVTYTFNAENACGGTDSKTATLHIVGAIETVESIGFNSIYFPTDLPKSADLQAGLVSSQQTVLTNIADRFKNYLTKQPDAHLTLAGFADERGPDDYNQSLSERRAEAAKDFLVAQGVPADHLDTQGYGKQQNLTEDQVKDLLAKNSALTDDDRQKIEEKMQTVVLANNRRVDIVLSGTHSLESAQAYPYNAPDYSVLVGRNVPGAEGEGAVQQAAERKKMSN